MGYTEARDEDRPIAGIVVNDYNGQTAQQRVVEVHDDGREDYLPACVGTALCPLVGLVATCLCCPSPHGKLGAATGCAWFNLWRAVFLLVAILLAMANVINCDESLLPCDISQSSCMDMGGNFTDGGCYDVCPEGFTLQLSERDNYSQWCEDVDPTCLGLSQHQITIQYITAVLFFVVAMFFAKKYTREITERTA